MISLQRVCLTRDRKKAVPAKDPKARWLLVHKGGEISEKKLALYPGAAKLAGSRADGDTAPVVKEREPEDDLETGGFTEKQLKTLAENESLDIGNAKGKPNVIEAIRAARKAKIAAAASDAE